MTEFGPAALMGLCIGFMWGIGCALAILYSIYLAGYRKAAEDSLLPQKSKRWTATMNRIEEKRAKEQARSAEN